MIGDYRRGAVTFPWQRQTPGTPPAVLIPRRRAASLAVGPAPPLASHANRLLMGRKCPLPTRDIDYVTGKSLTMAMERIEQIIIPNGTAPSASRTASSSHGAAHTARKPSSAASPLAQPTRRRVPASHASGVVAGHRGDRRREPACRRDSQRRQAPGTSQPPAPPATRSPWALPPRRAVTPGVRWPGLNACSSPLRPGHGSLPGW